MAIDTPEKRASVHAYSGNDSALVGRLDGIAAINAADRSHITDRYRGIAAGSPSGVTVVFRKTLSRIGTGVGKRQTHKT